MGAIDIRECSAIEELDACIQLQREVFALPDLEISPRRHLIVTRQAGGWTLGAFVDGRLVGFVHHLVAVRGKDEITGYSHMLAIANDYQNRGLGAQLKWAQRARAMQEGRCFIRWTWDPMQARNAHFNLNRLGVTAHSYAENFYGTDYATAPARKGIGAGGIDSDRLFASWELNSPRVQELAAGRPPVPLDEPVAAIDIPADWTLLLREDVDAARQEQLRVRSEFKTALATGLICAGFERNPTRPRYLLYESHGVR
jgi:predicted GNAT superfamily acetyltransferase